MSGAPVDVLVEVLGPAVKMILRTTLGAFVLTVLVAAVCVLIAADGSWFRGALGASVAVVLGVAVGGILAIKRGILEAVAVGVRRLGLGRRTLGALIDRMASVGDAEEWKERGGSLVRSAERLPLAEAAARLRGAVEARTGESATTSGARGWLARKVHSVLLDTIETMTLARFREADAQNGGVDVLRVRDELSVQVDELIVAAIRKAMVKLTASFTLAALAVALFVAFCIRAVR
jgi:hypothetical protein